MAHSRHITQIELRYCQHQSLTAARVTNFPKANIKSEAYGYAIADATKAIELDPDFVKVRLKVAMENKSTALTFLGLFPPCCCIYCDTQIPRRAQRFQDCC